MTVSRETTAFNLPDNSTAFVTPQARAGDGFAGSKPSYEEPYYLDQPVGTKSSTGLGFTFPALFRIGGDGWMLLSETGVSSGYAGTRLGDPTADGIYPIRFPEAAENGGIGEPTVTGALPLTTSWKTHHRRRNARTHRRDHRGDGCREAALSSRRGNTSRAV